MSEEIRINRSRTCNLCMREKHRVRLPAPKSDDPNYTISVCPDCDLTVGNQESRKP